MIVSMFNLRKDVTVIVQTKVWFGCSDLFVSDYTSRSRWEHETKCLENLKLQLRHALIHIKTKLFQ